MNQDVNHPLRGCRRWRRRLPWVTALPENSADWNRWREHAADCSYCRQVLAWETEVRRMLSVKTWEEPASVVGAVSAAVRRRSPRVRVWRPSELRWGLAGGLAGIALGLLVALSVPPEGYTESAARESDNGYLADYLDALPAGWSSGEEL